MVLKCICYSKSVLKIAKSYGWYPGAKYTNLRDIRSFNKIGFIDIEWKAYDFDKHIYALTQTEPILTVAKDIENIKEFDEVIKQAEILNKYSKYVIIVPKDRKLSSHLEEIPSKYILGYSVPTKYGGTKIPIKYFNRPVHLLGGRPDTQINLAAQMQVVSFDCNRFTLDAKYGYYFDGHSFRKNSVRNYQECISSSLKNINEMWRNYGK